MGNGGGEPDPVLAIERKYGNRNAAREEGKKLGVLLLATWSFLSDPSPIIGNACH